MKKQSFLPGTAAFLVIALIAVPLHAFSLNDLPKQIPAKTDTYTITQVQQASTEGLRKYFLHTPHADYEVEGLKALAKLIHEIEVIERIRASDQGSGFFDGAAASVEATAVGLGNLVAHPVKSAQGIGKAAGKLGRGVGSMFRKKSEGEKSSMGEKMLGSSKRELAKEFGVDVYTTNPYLSSMLDNMARSRMGGKGAVTVIKFLIPVALLASVVMTAGTLNSAADQLVNDSSRRELYRLNKKALTAIGLSEEDVSKLLDKPFFTPREQTYLRFYLEKLQKVENFHSIVKSVLAADTEGKAHLRLFEAEIAAEYHDGQVQKVTSYEEGLAVREKSGRLILIGAYDSLEPEGLAQKVLNRMKVLKAENPPQFEFWNGGAISDSFKASAYREKVSVKPWLYFEVKK